MSLSTLTLHPKRDSNVDWATINARLHPSHSFRNSTQNNRSDAGKRGCGRKRVKTATVAREPDFLGAGRGERGMIRRPEQQEISAGET